MIYFIQSEEGGPIKIGTTNKPINQRFLGIQQSCPYKLKILGCMDGGLNGERKLHKKFELHRLHGEWFSPHDDITNFISLNTFQSFPLPVPKSIRKIVNLPDDKLNKAEHPYSHKHINLLIPQRQWDSLKSVSKRLEIPVSELIRRIFDFSLQQESLNQIVPSMSGQVSVKGY